MSEQHEQKDDIAPVIRTVGLTRKFDDTIAVDNLNLTIAPGAIFGLLGPNGAGKTTTIKMLTTLLAPTAGTALIDGYDVVKDSAQVRRRIGYVPQLLSADGALTGTENLMLSARLYRIPRKDRKTKITDALRFMGLEEAAHTLVRKYSGGMVRRLEIAQAMLHRPAVLFLDEPTIGLDPIARHLVWDRLREMRDAAMTILLTTHDMEEADALCGTLAIMHRGVIAAQGSPAQLKAGIGPSATLDEVFALYGGGSVDAGGNYRDIRDARSTAQRLG